MTLFIRIHLFVLRQLLWLVRWTLVRMADLEAERGDRLRAQIRRLADELTELDIPLNRMAAASWDSVRLCEALLEELNEPRPKFKAVSAQEAEEPPSTIQTDSIDDAA